MGPQAFGGGAQDIPINDTGVYPESLDVGADGTLYLGSWKGVIYRALPRQSATAWVRPDTSNGLLTILGVAVDVKRNQLWACSVPAPNRDPPAPGISTLLSFDLDTGRLKLSLPLPPPASVCNDIAVAADDTAYVSDTPNGRIFAVRPKVNKLELFAQEEELKGIDGITFSASGQLYINLVTQGTLFRVGMGKDGKFAGLTAITPSRALDGPDGFRLIGKNRFLIAENKGGTIDEVIINGDEATVRTLREGLMTPTSAVFYKGTVYGVERKFQYVRDPAYQGKDPGPFNVLAFDSP